MPSPLRLLAQAAVVAFTLGSLVAQATTGAIRYGRDVRPILADRCFRCHGPDAGTRQAGLRLDLRDEAVADRDGGAAIVPGEPERSALWRRITSHDDDERMPPPSSGKPPLSAAERDVLAAWLRQGANYEPHWAFQRPQQPAVPAGSAAHPIDRFLDHGRGGLPMAPAADRATLARRTFLTVTGLPPTPAELDAFLADPAPTAAAQEHLLDRLFGTEPYRSRHAEHLAQPWLDAARYADTSGIHMDAGRQAWAWRDWLLQALRDDLPFDQFVRDQLAGDLLPEASTQQRIATGFLRHHVTTDEGGAIDEEYRVEYAAERTATVGSVFLGLTLGCVRCHDHKYDPISQADYYGLFAFFNSNREPGLYSQVPDANRALEPAIEVPTAEQAAQLASLQQRIQTAEHELAAGSPEDAAGFAAFQAAVQADLGSWLRPAVTRAHSRHGATLEFDASAGAVVASGQNPDHDVHEIVLALDGDGWRWLGLEALPHASHPDGKVGRAPNGNAVLQHVQLAVRPAGGDDAAWREIAVASVLADVEQDDGDFTATNLIDDDRRGWAVGAHRGPPRPARAALLAATSFGSPGPSELRVTLHYDSVHAQHTFARVRLSVARGPERLLAQLPLATSRFHVAGPFTAPSTAALYATRFGPEASLRLDPTQRWNDQTWRFDRRLRPDRANSNLPEGQHATYIAQELWAPTARTAVVKLGSDDGFELWCNGTAVAARQVDRGVDVDQDEATLELPAGRSLLVLKVVNTGGAGGFAIRHVADPAGMHGALAQVVLPGASESDAAAAVTQAWRDQHSPHHRAATAALAALQRDRDAVQAAVPKAMVMHEADTVRPTFVLTRGEYDKPDPTRPVARAIPRVFGALAADQPQNRLGLANWLVSAENPLLDRVAMNRLWEFVFGTGLVRTSEDFGLQGEWPSHPELLDWLAVEFRARGHSMRAMLRLLLTSDAFARGSTPPAAASERDRENRLLAWFPRRRLHAEAIRDQALYVGGLLVERTGGPSVKPRQPEGLWQEVAMLQSNTRVYEAQAGDALWRRSLYTYWKRACPPPNLLTLDAPTREFCTIRRTITNTPLQALVLWNDEQFVEAARGLAERTLRDQATDAERLHQMHRRCTGKPLSATGLPLAMATLQQLRARFATAPADAEALLRVGAHPRGDQPALELAPWTVLATAFLNLDATLCVD